MRDAVHPACEDLLPDCHSQAKQRTRHVILFILDYHLASCNKADLKSYLFSDLLHKKNHNYM